MRTYQPQHPLISFHIFKAGGTSIIDVLQHWFGDNFFQHYPDWNAEKPPPRVPIEALQEAGRSPICIHGHFTRKVGGALLDFYPQARQFITFVREPVACHVSAYYYQKAKYERGELYWEGRVLDFFPFKDIDFYFRYFNSFMLDDLPWQLRPWNFDYIMRRKFIHVGLVDAMQPSLDRLAEKLGQPPVAVPHRNRGPEVEQWPDAASIRIFRKKNPMAFRLYDFARKLNQA